MLIMPLGLISLFGFLNFGGTNTNVFDVTIIDVEQSELSSVFLQAANNANNLNSTTEIANIEPTMEVARDKLEANSNLSAVVVIPSDFSQGNPNIKIYYAPNEVTTFGFISITLDQLLKEIFYIQNQVPQDQRYNNFEGIQAIQVAGIETFNYRIFITAGIIAMALMQTAVFGAMFGLVGFKTQGVLRRMRLTPTHPIQIVLGHSLALITTIILQGIIFLFYTAALFSDFRDNLFALDWQFWIGFFILILLGGLLFLLLGSAVGGRVKSENTASGVANFVTLPMLFLSGVFFSISAYPDWLVSITQYLPLTYLVDGFRVLFNSDGFAGLGIPVLGLAVWIVILAVISMFTFRWE